MLKNVESSQWAMALKGASEELKEKILGNMSKRAARHAARRNGISRRRSGSRPSKQVQQQIVDIVRRLEDAGEITLHAAEAEEELVQ